MSTPYEKPALTSSELVALLCDKGLLIEDAVRAERYVKNIGYHRLSTYFSPFYKTDKFYEDTTFDDLLSLYIFDRKLRLLTLDPIQRIEVAVRAEISNYMSIEHGAFWFLDSALFHDKDEHAKFVESAKKCAGRDSKQSSQACRDYHLKYGDHDLPPSWILIEELPMGCWSKIFSNLISKQDKRAIAAQFHFNWRDFHGWLHPLSIVRNLLAHHRRFWNCIIPVSPPKIEKYATDCGAIQGSYKNFVVIMAMLKTFIHQTQWPKRLASTLESCPLDIHQHMCFPYDWEEMPFWQTPVVSSSASA